MSALRRAKQRDANEPDIVAAFHRDLTAEDQAKAQRVRDELRESLRSARAPEVTH